ncbi:hypothetical protein F6Q10_17425 [Streptomyces vinaceus]|nr:hypothetical protein [Streptomyces vinaceus]
MGARHPRLLSALPSPARFARRAVATISVGPSGAVVDRTGASARAPGAGGDRPARPMPWGVAARARRACRSPGPHV